MFPMLGIRDGTFTGKLVRLLSMLAPTLTIALSGDGAVAPAWGADISGRQHEVDVGEDVVNAVRVMFDAACVHDHRGFSTAIKSSSFDYPFSRNSADLRSDGRRIPHRQLARRLPVVGAGIDELLIDEVLFDQYV